MALPICTAPPLTFSDSAVSSDGGKRRPVDAVAAGAAADGHDQVAGLRLLAAAVHRDQADGAAEDQRIGEVALVEADGPVDGRECPCGCRSRARRPRRPCITFRGCSTPGGSDSGGVSGGAKQKTSVLQIGLAPRPVPSGSRMTPPRPVLAPP